VRNDQQFDPNTSANRNRASMQINPPREVHTLNDAILAAAIATSKAGKGRRRVVYVISDGKEYGSQAKYKDVVKYLQTNKVAVYGTLVGDSSLPVVGYLDKIHLPLMMKDNLLPAYASETGGYFDAEFRQKGIEQSFARITEEARNQYTIGYYTHEPFIDGKYRPIEVKVLKPGLNVIAKKGYFPSATDIKPANPVTPQ
jgi:VWFA-related protein